MIADPSSRRWEFYQRELRQFWQKRNCEPVITVVPWRDLIDSDGRFPDSIAGETSLLRIESPARDFAVKRALLQAGDRAEGRPPAPWRNPGGEKGWLASPRLVHLGFCRVLEGLDASLKHHPQITPTARTSDIARLFDKNATSGALREAGLPTPDWFHPTTGIDGLHREVARRQWRTTYLKLAHGSSAAGIAVLNSHEPSLTTTVHEENCRYYSTRRVKSLLGRADLVPEIENVLRFLIAEGATVQKGIPKMRIGTQNFDVRVVVIGDNVAACVFRISSHPMTNLHLGGRRGDAAECRRVIPQRQWLDAMDFCVEAASLFALPAVGVDVAFDRRTLEPTILELNAFGDFFPHWENERGQSVHELEIENTARRHGLLS